MSERPTLDEISSFLADLKSACTIGGDFSELVARKAELLERIADAMPGDQEAADAARTARAVTGKERGDE
ncbi:hypothetical protein [Streptomyces sp. CRN 30]|uniref:hypothetical protein n=1 Tax=Streptomyces sp. CRN 30 TaxID=3075613 RepID=UPI002A81EB28|nr:hypothetical protein [Streptomyces sp. CRN 30]